MNDFEAVIFERNEAIKSWDNGRVWLGIDNDVEVRKRITASKSFLYIDQDCCLFRDYQNTTVCSKNV